jgi:acetyl-CoA synthetase
MSNNLPFEEYVVNSSYTFRSPREYWEKHGETLRDLEGFWVQVASELEWFEKWQKVLDDTNPPFYRWFVGGRINLSYLALDANIKKGRGSKTALIWEGEPVDSSGRPLEVRRLTYLDLYREVNRAALALRELGVGKGDRIAVYLPMIPEVFVFMLAAWRLGAITSVVFSGFAAEALADRIADAGAKLLVTADGFWRRGRIVPLKEVADKALERAGSVEKVVVVSRLGAGGTPMRSGRDLWWHELVAGIPDEVYVEPARLESEHPSFILYTSGTTGKPKGIVHDTGGWAVHVYATMKWVFDVREDDVYWCTADVGWVTGHSYVVLGPLLVGATTVVYEGAPDYPQPDRWWSIIERYKVSIFYTSPTAIRMFMKFGEEWPRRHDLSSLRIIHSVGEPINPEAWRWAYRVLGGERVVLGSTWWMTETGGIMISHAPGFLLVPMKPGTNGPPLPGVDADVVDSKGESVPPGVKGYLVIRRPWPGMLHGIWGDPERYIATYWSRFPGMFYAGDYAVKDGDGYIWVLGRADEVLKVAGHRLGTYEIESALVGHPAVAEAAVVGVPDPIKAETPVAFVVLKQGHRPSPELREELRKRVRLSIGPVAEPSAVFFVSKVPKTRSGKIMRRLLRAIALNAPLGDVSTLEDETSVEEARRVFEELRSEVWRSIEQFVRRPLVVPKHTTVKELAERLLDEKFAVVSSDGRTVEGVVSERDLVRAAAGDAGPETPVAEVMRREVVAVDASTPYHEALKLLAQKRIRHLVVLRGGELAGVVSARDLLGEHLLILDEQVREALSRLRVRDYMKKPAVAASPKDSIRAVAKLMSEKNVGLVVLMEDGKLYGVVSEYDVVNALRNGKSLDSPADSIATTSVVTIPADAPLSTAAELMTENRIRHLVVLEGGKVVGVISLRDIISAIRE